MRTLIIGDIHGCASEFFELLDKAALGAEDRASSRWAIWWIEGRIRAASMSSSAIRPRRRACAATTRIITCACAWASKRRAWANC